MNYIDKNIIIFVTNANTIWKTVHGAMYWKYYKLTDISTSLLFITKENRNVGRF